MSLSYWTMSYWTVSCEWRKKCLMTTIIIIVFQVVLFYVCETTARVFCIEMTTSVLDSRTSAVAIYEEPARTN